MAPRVPILSALRQGISAVKSSMAPLSTTASSKALKDLDVSKQRSILNVDAEQRDSTALALDIYSSMKGRTRGVPQERQRLEEQIANSHKTDDHMRQLSRRWNIGDIYAPHDMSPSEMAKWRRNKSRQTDLVDLLGLQPLDLYRNFSVISEFMTPHGRIKRAVDTGLRPVNQRKMAKAIRRAIGLGLHPSVHRHPELLMRGPNKMPAQNTASFFTNKSQKWLP